MRSVYSPWRNAPKTDPEYWSSSANINIALTPFLGSTELLYHNLATGELYIILTLYKLERIRVFFQLLTKYLIIEPININKQTFFYFCRSLNK